MRKTRNKPIVDIKPFLKWAGGKRQLLPEIRNYLPTSFNRYFEPFLGAGAVLFDLKPQSAVVNDTNEELINCYRAIQLFPNELVEHLKKHKNEKDYFYHIRSLDRTQSFKELTQVERASRIIYLNKTCYNGLFRVNSKGEFNAPFGRYKNPDIVQEDLIWSLHDYLNKNQIDFYTGDFESATDEAVRGDFVYFDPPYDPVSDTSSFTGYQMNQFGKNEQKRLLRLFDQLTMRGCKVMLSNSSTPFIRDLYKDYKILTISAYRFINSKAEKRGKIDEVLILNYEPTA